MSYCKEPRTLQEISEHLGYSDKYRMKRFYIDPLLGDVLTMTSKESKTDPNQKYVVKEKLIHSSTFQQYSRIYKLPTGYKSRVDFI